MVALDATAAKNPRRRTTDDRAAELAKEIIGGARVINDEEAAGIIRGLKQAIADAVAAAKPDLSGLADLLRTVKEDIIRHVDTKFDGWEKAATIQRLADQEALAIWRSRTDGRLDVLEASVHTHHAEAKHAQEVREARVRPIVWLGRQLWAHRRDIAEIIAFGTIIFYLLAGIGPHVGLP